MKIFYLQANENRLVTTLSQIKYGAPGQQKTPAAGNSPGVSSESGSLEKIRPSIGMYRFLR